jgi:uncharacterized membrane protein
LPAQLELLARRQSKKIVNYHSMYRKKEQKDRNKNIRGDYGTSSGDLLLSAFSFQLMTGGVSRFCKREMNPTVRFSAPILWGCKFSVFRSGRALARMRRTPDFVLL